MFEDFQIELNIRFTKMRIVNPFLPKTLSVRIEQPPALSPRRALRSQLGVSHAICFAVLMALLNLPLGAQTRLSSSQVRNEVSRLSANDQRQDLRLYNLEKDVDYLQRKSGYTPRGPSTVSAKSTVQTLPTTTSYTVRPGDTVWRIAMNHRVSPGEIMQLNGLKSDSVNAGQTLKIPAKGSVPPPAPISSQSAKSSTASAKKPSPPVGGTHIIQKGETFSQIAQQHGVSQSALKQANPQVNPDVIIVGAKLYLPTGSKAAPSATPPAIQAPKTSTTPASGTAGSRRHTVRPGETLSSIAASYGVSATSLQRSNYLSNPDRLSIGQVITIPAGAAPAVARTEPLPKPATPTYPANPSSSSSAPSTPTVSPGPAPQSNPRGVLSYRVHSTDTLESIASTFGTTPEKIRELNRKPAGSKVTPDEEILVPAMGAVSL